MTLSRRLGFSFKGKIINYFGSCKKLERPLCWLAVYLQAFPLRQRNKGGAVHRREGICSIAKHSSPNPKDSIQPLVCWPHNRVRGGPAGGNQHMWYFNICETIRCKPEQRAHSWPHSVQERSKGLTGSNAHSCEQCFPLTSKSLSEGDRMRWVCCGVTLCISSWACPRTWAQSEMG